MKDKSKQCRFRSTTASDLFSSTDSKENKICAFCSGSNHRANDCNYAKILTPNEKNSILRTKKKKLLFQLSYPFPCSSGLQRKIICNNCRRKHATIMCEDFKGKANKSSKTKINLDC